ncbi:hypothetical protein [Carboxylicivirga sp. N1Y90]|uniref:hypothetical protein n=1 Tax=Carboxylicivirga fragile TaxID=3417571 RepID=UPI003D32F31C|nr:hypothetical protein [Marinilabiliaceae bacterium N1Y90]
MKQLFIAVILALLFTTCKEETKDTNNQGVITYAISYPEEIANQGFASFLPEKMISIFKDDHFKLNLSGEFNFYNLEYISRSKGDTCFTLFKIFDKKLFYPQQPKENLFLFQDQQLPQIEFFEDSVKTIAGIKCTKAVANFKDNKVSSAVLYYTEELGFSHSNVNTPFSEIPGTLMEFSVVFQGLELSMQAESVKFKEIDQDEFIIPKNYKRTNQNEIKDIVSSLIQL